MTAARSDGVPSGRFDAAAPLLAFALPFAVATFNAGTSMGFYDAPELTTSGSGLGVTHPPGHPLWVLLASLASLMPVGPIALRIELLSALCLGVIARCAYAVTLPIVRASLGGEGQRLAPLFALSASLTAVLGTAVMRQATRVEVYALAGALAVGVLALSRARELPVGVRARGVVLVTALGGTNHHFIALTAVPLALAVLYERMRVADWATRRRAVLAWAAFGAVGLLPYALLPLRNHAAASMVRVRTLGDLVWTVSARAFQKNMGRGVPGTFGQHLLDVLDWIGTSITPLGILGAFVGLYALVARRDDASRDVRGDALRLFVLFAVVAFARASLGFVAHNPDAAGYIVPAVVALACLASAFPAVAWKTIRDAPAAPEGPTPGARKVLMAVLVVAPLCAPLWLVYASRRDTEADRTGVPEDIAEAVLHPLPARAVALVYSPDTAFLVRHAMLVEGERPDVTIVPVPFLPYPGTTNALLGRDEDLLPLVRDYLAHGEARIEQIAALATTRPVRMEIDPHNVLAMVPYLVPRGPLAEVRGEPTTLASVRGVAAAHFGAMDALATAMQSESNGGADVKSSEYVLWRNYNDAVFYAARGARPEARNSLRRAMARAPEAAELLGLRDALNAPGEGPVEVRPFVVGEYRPE